MAHNRHSRGRKDGNHKQIVADLEARGFVVFDVSGLKSLGFDIVIFCPVNSRFNYDGFPKWFPFEIKQPDRKDKLTMAEVKAQQRTPIPVVSSVEEILTYF